MTGVTFRTTTPFGYLCPLPAGSSEGSTYRQAVPGEKASLAWGVRGAFSLRSDDDYYPRGLGFFGVNTLAAPNLAISRTMEEFVSGAPGQSVSTARSRKSYTS